MAIILQVIAPLYIDIFYVCGQDHKLAAEIRQQIWMAQDKAAGYR